MRELQTRHAGTLEHRPDPAQPKTGAVGTDVLHNKRYDVSMPSVVKLERRAGTGTAIVRLDRPKANHLTPPLNAKSRQDH